jgi:hypothetical protein
MSVDGGLGAMMVRQRSVELPVRCVLVALLCVSASVGCGPSSNGAPSSQLSDEKVLRATLAALNLSDPVTDLDANLAKQDRRFIGVNGYTCTAPGVFDADGALVKLYGLRCLSGTSDAIQSTRHEALVAQAKQYASTYNVELQRRLSAGAVR